MLRHIKRWKRRILFMFIGALAGIMLFFIIAQVNFTIRDELEVVLSPSAISFEAENRAEQVAQFNLENDNFFYCNSFCTYEFKDISEGKIIDKGNVSLESDQEFGKSYNITSPDYGEGQKVFIFETQCSNVRSTFCKTSGQKRYKSSIVTLNYRLSADEKLLKERLAISLRALAGNLTKQRAALKRELILTQSAFSQLASVPQEFYDYRAGLRGTESELNQTMKRAQRYLSLWESEEYNALNNEFSSAVPSWNGKIARLVEKHNALTEIVSSLSEREALNDAYEFYTQVSLPAQAFQAKDLIADINDLTTLVGRDFKYDEALFAAKNLSSRASQLEAKYLENSSAEEKALNESMFIARYQLGLPYIDWNCTISDETNAIIEAHNSAAKQYMKAYENDTQFAAILQAFKARQIAEARALLGEDVEIPIVDYGNYSGINFTNYTTITPVNANICSNISRRIQFKKSALSIIILPEVNSTSQSIEIRDNKKACCLQGICKECCEACSEPYPVIFIHGHSPNERNSPEYALTSFAKMQHRLMDEGYINAGQLDIEDLSDDISAEPWPVSYRASYYYIKYYDLGAYEIAAQKSDSIENYAIRLKEIIDAVKQKTGRDKVNIVAHSMGGLVAREYMALFGEESIDRLVLVATPNKGVTGSVKNFCGYLGGDNECKDLAEGSIFLKRLNSPVNNLKQVKVTTIAAVGCTENGDGIVEKDSVRLDYAENYIINGTCTDFLNTDLHSNILDPDLYPETYHLILKSLE